MSIAFQNVHKTLRQKNKKTKVFEAAHVVFEPDRITGILAAPGAGKSTAANLMTGKLHPDLGRVQRSTLVSFPIASGGVFNGALTGRENLAFLCRVFGFDPRPIIRFVVDFAELGKAIDKPFKLYSRDERTKMMFASAYAIPFDIYVIDESMIGGRGQFRDKCDALVRERMKTAGFAVFSSAPSLLRKYCNDIYVIDKLRFCKTDTVEEAVAMIGETQLRDGEGYTETVADGGDSSIINP